VNTSRKRRRRDADIRSAAAAARRRRRTALTEITYDYYHGKAKARSQDFVMVVVGRLKMREWKNREQVAGCGKCRSRLAVWKAEPILYSDTALSYFLEIVSGLKNT